MTAEFDHYPGCRHRDPDSCSGCALTDERQASPNYSAWPLAYMENRRAIPAKWREAFKRELLSDNTLYVENIRRTMERLGVRFTDGRAAMTEDQIERKVERMMDHLDRLFLQGEMSQEAYDKAIRDLDKWSMSRRAKEKPLLG